MEISFDPLDCASNPEKPGLDPVDKAGVFLADTSCALMTERNAGRIGIKPPAALAATWESWSGRRGMAADASSHSGTRMTKKKLASPQVLAEEDGEAPSLIVAWFDDAEHWQGDTFIKRGRGRPKLPQGAKELISLRLEPEVLARLRGAGPGWRSRVNAILKAALGLDKTAPATRPGQPGEQLITAAAEVGRRAKKIA